MLDLSISTAHCHIRGIAPLSQSRQHGEPMLDGERHEDNDLTNDQKKRGYREVSVLGLIEHISKDRAAKPVLPTNRPLSVAETQRAIFGDVAA